MPARSPGRLCMFLERYSEAADIFQRPALRSRLPGSGLPSLAPPSLEPSPTPPCRLDRSHLCHTLPQVAEAESREPQLRARPHGKTLSTEMERGRGRERQECDGASPFLTHTALRIETVALPFMLPFILDDGMHEE